MYWGGLRTDENRCQLLKQNGMAYFSTSKSNTKTRDDLTRCAEDVLLSREAHFPATIADLYNPEKMPADLHEAHERTDALLARVYIGRRFRNATARRDKQLDLYTKITTTAGTAMKPHQW